MNAFRSEAELTQLALESRGLFEPIANDGLLLWRRQEPKGLFGVPDLVVACSTERTVFHPSLRICAFEFKLRNWTRALIQAYKYSSFAHYSFVVMDECFVHRAIQHMREFERSNIGLISISKRGDVIWHFHPEPRLPYSPQLHRKLESQIWWDSVFCEQQFVFRVSESTRLQP